MLEIKDLRVRFHGADHDAVRGIDLTVADGEIMGLVGESGSGKTVTAMVVSGLMPHDRADVSGQVLLDGKDLLALTPAQMRKRQGCAISVVFQEPMSAMNPVMRIGPQVEEALRVHTDLSAQERRQRALQALRDVDLPNAEEVYQKYPHQLSGGMLQRAMIAAAIISRPKLLLADEPTTALDVTIQAQVLAMIRELRDRLGTSMLMITHDLGIVAQTCDDVGVMYAGEIIESGTVEDIFLGDRHHPYTVGLFDSIPNLTSRATRLKPIPGLMPDPTALPDGCVFADRCSHCMEICSTQHPQVYTNGTHKLCCHLFDKELERGGQENGTQD